MLEIRWKPAQIILNSFNVEKEITIVYFIENLPQGIKIHCVFKLTNKKGNTP